MLYHMVLLLIRKIYKFFLLNSIFHHFYYKHIHDENWFEHHFYLYFIIGQPSVSFLHYRETLNHPLFYHIHTILELSLLPSVFNLLFSMFYYSKICEIPSILSNIRKLSYIPFSSTEMNI